MLRKVSIAIIMLLVFVSSAFSGDVISREYPYIYKSPRAMGMGGAYVAVGGTADALFYNPAGLNNLPDANGWEVNLIGLTGVASDNALEMIDDMQDAFDVGDLNNDGDTDDDQLRAVNDVLAEFRGENIHLTISDFVSIAKKTGKTSIALGGLANLRVDGLSHQGLGSNGLLDVVAEAHFGGIGGLSYEMFDNFYVGAALKYIYKESMIHTFTSREIVDNQDTLEDYLTNDLRENGDAVGVDAGVIYSFLGLKSLNPAIGLSVLNIGDMDFGDAGKMPMTANVGLSIKPEIPAFEHLIIALDYVDMFNNFSQDSDIPKRLRFGGELCLFKKKAIGMMVRAGLYQGYATAGIDLRLGLLTLAYVTYAEEVGAYAGQDDDRRHLAMINLGW
jgi:hypothetical protein